MRDFSRGVTLVFWLVSLPAIAAEYTWNQVTTAAAVSERDGAGAATHDGKMWLLGGWADDRAGGSGHVGYNDVWDTTNGMNWTELPDTPWPARHAGTVLVYDGHLWMVAGSHPGSTPINDVWRLDTIDAR